ncbi:MULTISPECIES: AMP-binding protein [Methylomicrobium]|uniref:Acyl-CoA synthetase/AMP-acid ligase n=1 Tax=Methylomicrobium album BG8 TaxID=686340 RepID=H8GI34_METAL|nr:MULTISPECIES: AMP-binding protein [Methylomicrobium]EIC30178.1 acyl-CoA synthetase/AMP-acid ligase [Methylomicrobium album BG8]
MQNNLISLAGCIVACGQDSSPAALHRGRSYRRDQFAAAVGHWATVWRRDSTRRYALYTQDAYPFAVGLFALLHADKEIWIPGNHLPETARQLEREGCRLLGDWPAADPIDPDAAFAEASGISSEALDPNVPRIMLYTSGSSGQPKAVPKNLRQLQAEIGTLENLWGNALENACIAGSVSHQHIYGLLFRVLWPLAARRCFRSAMALSPEMLLAGGEPARLCWIASPGHLKRLDERSPWREIADLAAIFSSGGPLPAAAAAQILSFTGRSVIEVYGSTETGGIAWRRADGRNDAPWQPFAGIEIDWRGGRPHLYSPYLNDREGLALDDRLTPLEGGRLLLHGRQDRIVKIEEKRLSLTALERCLQETFWISEAHALVLARHRDVIGIAAVLSERGAAQLKAQGRNAFIRQLRSLLAGSFDAVALPRKWLFVNAFPLTAQGKVNRELLISIMNTDTRLLPRMLAAETDAGGVRLQLRVPKELAYFGDHFPDFPLLPGVVQIGWAEYFSKLFFPIRLPFSHLEMVKFSQMIRPDDELLLSLEWRETQRKLHFQYSAGAHSCSSGRLVYGAES